VESNSVSTDISSQGTSQSDTKEAAWGDHSLPWATGKPKPWDVTVPDTYVESHTANTATTPGAAYSEWVSEWVEFNVPLDT